MSDEALRAAERRWRASGGVDVEAAFLQEQIRTGVLLAKRVEIAAVLGHPAAMVVTGRVATLPAYNRADLIEAVRGDQECMSRVCVAVALNLLATMPGEAEHDPQHEMQMAMGDMLLREASEHILTGGADVHVAASSAEAFMRAAGSVGQRIPFDVVRMVDLVINFFVEPPPEGLANTYRAIARGLIPWLLGRGDQVWEWMSGNTTSM